MANLSDAFGTVTVEKVGAEFVEFLEIAQGGDAYYKLAEIENYEDIKPDKNNDLEFDFSTMGRWAYYNNLEGYLEGNWMNNDEKTKKAHKKFLKALKTKDGCVTVEYTDSDLSMDWMGTGVAQLDKEGFNDNFEGVDIVLAKFAKLYGYTELEAFEYLHGYEAMEAYDKYVEQWKKDHHFVEGGSEPAGPEEWYDNEYEETL